LTYVSHLSLIIYFFFFSSRRRHTRSKRDWSSDVCSSDLMCCTFKESTFTIFFSLSLKPSKAFKRSCSSPCIKICLLLGWIVGRILLLFIVSKIAIVFSGGFSKNFNILFSA